MCGLAGFLETTHHLTSSQKESVIHQMSATLSHRGPDDQGVWLDPSAEIALGHRRLSIIDLSQHGHQPMQSACERYVMVYNGEIYNYLEIRKELQDSGVAVDWRGNSDTEVMLTAISHWGLEKAITRFTGMFAFALWDKKYRTLKLARDRLGEKPLYYGWMNKTFLFASELKALRKYPGWQGEIDRNVLALFLRYNCIPAPYSIYKNIFKLLPGTFISVKQEDITKNTTSPITPNHYWSAREIAEAGASEPLGDTEEETINQLDAHLRSSIKGQMVADVPLGAFLSGGVDSSTVVALMQAQSTQRVKTFTIGFEEEAYNEAHDAKAVAKHLGTDHTELYVTPQEAMSVIPNLPSLYDEPFSDSSQIPTYLISKLARQHVTVSLSGDGGDELFGGYNRYFWGKRIWKKINRCPGSLRHVLNWGIKALPPMTWDSIFQFLDPLFPESIKQRNPGDKLHKLAGILTSKHPQEMYLRLASHWSSPESVVPGSEEVPTLPTNPKSWANIQDFTSAMMYLDMVCYLPDDILVKVDRASMGISLETRVPFLDHRVVEFAWKVPMHMKIRDNQGKWLLRQVLYKYVPKELIERPKMGFAVPIDSWLRGPLRDWAEDLLSPDKLKNEGFFNPEPIRKIWQAHLSGRSNYQHHLWDVLMFQAWLKDQKTIPQ
ncbi:MAG: asparagine synthase (glutamine-hydrolyzing) [Nitrospina sp.]|jgi:asparagine synthase (glutamine-hydrolysing)|nr:asparagine synthase (glutamine-hydrolyzing) [Nitrospina sp.]MBT7197079.1 asparagine synthase (glutamine-hydrolyzing) [Nitrospina sp.]